VDYDGRPIFKIPCPDFVSMLKGINPRIEIIPAHIWTPHFAMFGSNSGFDSLKECFGSQAVHIHAIETGLSSDPPMNYMLSQLDNLSILSFSDLHSYWPWRIGREATVFDTELSYDALIKSIHTGEGLVETIEVDPNYGKYHFDGHRNCHVCMHPGDSEKHHGLCPVCGRPMTIGVLHRVKELADRTGTLARSKKKPFRYLMPLHELISLNMGKGIATGAVWKEYYTIMKAGRNEYDVLLNVPLQALRKHASEDIVELIMLNRKGRIRVSPGYDGEYGRPEIGKREETAREYSIAQKPAQRGLADFF
jgi:uncharacterized protein (TIGR00375 family)